MFLFLAGCSIGEDSTDYVSTEAFYKLYPSAKIESDEMVGDYQIVEFKSHGTKLQAWFDKTGWLVTIGEIADQSVVAELKTSLAQFKGWQIEHVCRLERSAYEDLLVVTIERNGVVYDLYLDMNGVIIRQDDVTGSELENRRFVPSELPKQVEQKVMALYPNGRIFDVESLSDAVEVLVYDNGKSKFLIYDREGEWLYSAWKLKPEEVNGVIVRDLNAELQDCEIENVIYTKTTSSEIYIVECSVNGAQQSFYISPEGKILY